jgi:GWxTD domain-containing protein
MLRTFLLLGLVTLTCANAVAQQQVRKPRSNSPVQTDLKSVYQKWLDEDVVYIITAEESRALLMLKTDVERERFIEQFWRARNPNPATGENAYRTEHYRRIAHANQNFGSDNLPGWRTARGRFYITLGKPDEIQKTSSSEVWFYRYGGSLGNNIEIEFTSDSSRSEIRVRQRP